MSKQKLGDLLDKPLKVINIGLEGFANELDDQSIDVIHVEWAPPAGGNLKLAYLLSRLGS